MWGYRLKGTAMSDVRGLISWLTDHPQGEALARTLAADFLAQKGGCTDCIEAVGHGSLSEIKVREHTNPEPLTSRQKLILQGMVDGKTNHELATELGFSVSTIRHETMRIYQSLAVSDRREAARAALDQGLI